MGLNREIIDSLDKKYFLKGKKKQADVYLIEVENKKIVVKDYKNKSLFIKLYGKRMAKREYENYLLANRLFDFFPKTYGMPDKYSLAIEFIDGKTFGDVEKKEEYCFAVNELKKCIKKLHSENIFHLDLRKRGNIIIKEKSVYLIDLVSMVNLTKFSLLNLVKPILKLADTSSVLKWKQFICPSKLTEEEKEKLKKFQWVRMLWVFNKPKLPGKD